MEEEEEEEEGSEKEGRKMEKESQWSYILNMVSKSLSSQNN